MRKTSAKQTDSKQIGTPRRRPARRLIDRAGWPNHPHRRMGSVTMVLMVAAGCGGGPDVGEIRVPADQRHVVSAGGEQATTLELPADHAFNIHLKKSSQNPGPDGKALATSDATRDGQASCEATASNGGTAEADFTLGHRLEGRFDGPQSVDATILFELDQAVRATSPPTPRTRASAHLTLMVMDSKERIVAQTPLAQSTSDDLITTGSTTDQRHLTVRFEPDLSYDVILFGEVSAEADEGQDASARLEVRRLIMRLTFAPAPTDTAPE